MSPPRVSRSRPEQRFYAWEIFLFNWRTLHSGSAPGGTGENAEKCTETKTDTMYLCHQNSDFEVLEDYCQCCNRVEWSHTVQQQ